MVRTFLTFESNYYSSHNGIRRSRGTGAYAEVNQDPGVQKKGVASRLDPGNAAHLQGFAGRHVRMPLAVDHDRGNISALVQLAIHAGLPVGPGDGS